MSRRGVIVAACVLAATLCAVVLGTLRLIRQARLALVAQLADAELHQVDEISRIVHDDIDQIASDLALVGRLVQTGESGADRTREIGALLAASKQYHAVGIFNAAGERMLWVSDPEPSLHADVFEAPMRDTARAALGRRDGELESTAPLEVNGGWFRVFAMPLRATSASSPAVVAVLLDTQRLFDKLRLATADPASHLLLLGPRGRPTSVSDPKLAATVAELDAWRPRAPQYAGIVDAMRRGERGFRRLSVREAEALGLGSSGLVAAFAPIEARGRGLWSVATITSTAQLEKHERALVLRLGAASAAVALSILGFAAWLVVATRRAGALRERLRVAEEIAVMHSRTQKILDNIPTGVMSLSVDGRVTAVNHVLRERVPEPLLGRPLAEALPDMPRSALAMLRSHLDAALASGRVRSLFGERLSLFGEEGQYNLHAVPLDPAADEARMLLVIEDVSRVRALESQLLRAEKLATVGELAAGVAHEVGTPLGIVRGRAEYVLGKLGALHPQAAGISEIIDQIDQVTRTIRQLLDFSRVSPASVQRVALAPVVSALADLLRFEAERKKIALTVEVDDDLEPLSADPDQLQQVIVNLLKNAFDACAAGGSVAVRASAEPRGDAMWSRARIEVTDDGCGIAARDLPRIFDPFFTTKKRGQGTGLGLAIVAQVVRNHGGEIALDSEPGRGTRVRVLWPVADAAEVALEHHA